LHAKTRSKLLDLKKNWFYIIISLIIVDQISKILIQQYIPLNSSSIVIIPKLLYFTHITNDGISFGWNPFSSSILLFIVSVIACLFIVKVLFDSKKDTELTQISLCLIIGGAFGNLIDRFFTAFNLMGYTGVVDFIDVGYNYSRFYIFNFADSFITIGITLYILSFMMVKIFNGK